MNCVHHKMITNHPNRNVLQKLFSSDYSIEFFFLFESG